MQHQSSPSPPDSYNHFLATSLENLLAENQAVNPEEKFFDYFRHCLTQVPAYSAFLASCQVNPDETTCYKALPLMNKANYMQAYPLAERCLGGRLTGSDRVAVSSGSTGTPTFWPRSLDYEAEVAVRFEQVFHDSFRAHERSTLAVVCFALGNWVGGMYTTSCCWHLARKGYPLMVATPGNNKAEIFRIIRELAPLFEQTALLGYPPFIKDVIDAGIAEGINWPEYWPKLVFAGEVFSEEWRSLIGEHTGSTSVCYDSASLYGTADGGVLGNETPLSIAIRRWLAHNPEAARSLFGESRLPTLVQYDPHSRYFELEGDTLVVSAENSVPLLRYHIADKGGLIPYDAMLDFLREHGTGSLQDLGLEEGYQPRNLPFVFVFGRADFTVSYYGANIYPENVTVGLEQPELAALVTGKFVLETRESHGGDKYLHVAVELLPKIAPQANLSAAIADSILKQLLRLNSEFANYVPPDRQLPAVTLHAFADPAYFPAGVKHRYTRNKPVNNPYC